MASRASLLRGEATGMGRVERQSPRRDPRRLLVELGYSGRMASDCQRGENPRARRRAQGKPEASSSDTGLPVKVATLLGCVGSLTVSETQMGTVNGWS